MWDGHDEHAHHRRLDFRHPVAQQVGIKTNFMRYAHDFVVVTEQGELHRGNAKRNADSVLRSLTNMNLPASRVRTSSTTSPAVAGGEVQVFVR